MRRRFPDALAQSQVRFNRDPEKVPEKVWEALVQSQVPGSLGAKPSQVQRVPEKVEVLPRHTAIAKTVYIYNMYVWLYMIRCEACHRTSSAC